MIIIIFYIAIIFNILPYFKREYNRNKVSLLVCVKFEKLRAIRASAGGVGGVLAWVAC